MKRSNSTVARLTVLPLILALVSPLFPPANAAVAVGQTASAGTRVDGLQVPSGTTLLSPALVETGAKGAVIHLSNGQVVALSEEASALVESLEVGAIQVSMQAGKMAYTDQTGELTTVASNNLVVLDQAGQVGEGARIGSAPATDSDEEEELCQLQEFTPERFALCSDPDTKDDEDCEWEYLEVPMDEVPQYLNVDSVLACKDRNAIDLNCDCSIAGGGAAWWVVGGVGAAAALGIIINDNDQEPVASPTTP